MNEEFLYTQAISDFRRARRKAALQDIVNSITGKSSELLSFEAIRRKLSSVEMSDLGLREISLDAIVGSVGRYKDFTRNFLPRSAADEERWARIKSKIAGLSYLPPIEVYQIGNVYFVLDGNHRVSVARRMGATQIMANVTEVRTRIPINTDSNPDNLIIQAEFIELLDHTHIDKIIPEADLKVTNPGQYPILAEHIDVHRCYCENGEDEEIPQKEAIVNWYNDIYMPVIKIIRKRGILRYFPGRTETDLYLWLLKHRSKLERTLGWEIKTESVAEDLVFQYNSQKERLIFRVKEKFIDIIIPDSLEAGPKPGEWRKGHLRYHRYNHLFEDILVPISGEKISWKALEQAILIAQKENARILGLHVWVDKSQKKGKQQSKIKKKFNDLCKQADVSAKISFSVGGISRIISQRSRWADLVVTSLAHPPSSIPIAKLGSGFRKLILNCPRPIIAVPGTVSSFSKILLAYDGSPKAKEALFIASYFSVRLKSTVTAVTVIKEKDTLFIIDPIQNDYIKQERINFQSLYRDGKSISKTLLDFAYSENFNLIAMGGYGSRPVLEVVLGSVVDQVLRKAKIPVLICR